MGLVFHSMTEELVLCGLWSPPTRNRDGRSRLAQSELGLTSNGAGKPFACPQHLGAARLGRAKAVLNYKACNTQVGPGLTRRWNGGHETARSSLALVLEVTLPCV